MKNALLATVAFAFAVTHAAVASSVDFEAGETEVVVAAAAPKTVLFAAEEMTNFLSRAFDSPVPVVTSATPGRKYRISFFVRLKGVESRGKGGGVGVKVWHDRNEWFPRNRMTGTTDWIHQEYFFTAGPKSADFTSQFVIYLWNATGTVEYADLRIEPYDM